MGRGPCGQLPFASTARTQEMVGQERHPLEARGILTTWLRRSVLPDVQCVTLANWPFPSARSCPTVDPTIQGIVKKDNSWHSTVLINYHVNRGVVALPESVKESRIVSNSQVIPPSREDLDGIFVSMTSTSSFVSSFGSYELKKRLSMRIMKPRPRCS